MTLVDGADNNSGADDEDVADDTSEMTLIRTMVMTIRMLPMTLVK